MGLEPQILFGTVAHNRLFPKRNQFAYSIYYLGLPTAALTTPYPANQPLAINRRGLLSFHTKDHGACDGEDLEGWARNTLLDHGVTCAIGDIKLVCMPRVMGYVFNPVSFWFCCDPQGKIRAVLCQVNNTFGERHTYICVHDDQRVIDGNDTLTGQKLFHVSPFLKREGHYGFRFNLKDDKLGVWINFYDAEANKQLTTSLTGRFEPMTKASLRKAFWSYPLVTLKAMTLIHWQAAKLWTKGVKFITKPSQLGKQSSKATVKITKP